MRYKAMELKSSFLVARAFTAVLRQSGSFWVITVTIHQSLIRFRRRSLRQKDRSEPENVTAKMCTKRHGRSR